MKMPCATRPVFKSLPVANGCLLSCPSIFAAKASYRFLSAPSKSFRLQLACSYSSSSLPTLFSLRKKTHFPAVVAVLAAQREEDNALVLEPGEVETEGEEEGFSWQDPEIDETEAQESGWEADAGEEEEIDPIGDAAETGGEEGFVESEEEESYPEPPEEAKLFVGNLPYNVDSEKLAHVFEKAGIVEIAEVIYNRETDQSRGFGFVTMRTVEEAEKAVEMFHRYDLDGRLLTVNKAAPRGTQPERPSRVFPSRVFEPAYRIYVGNLPWDVDNNRLEQVFSEHGKVVTARVVYDRDSGRSRGFGFVTMSTEAEMNDAIANLDGQSVGGRAIRVNVAEERPRRSSF